MTHSELERWIAAWLEGRITSAESDALQQRLRESPEARETFRKFAQLDAVIREVADTEISRRALVAPGSTGEQSPSLTQRKPVASAIRLMSLRGIVAVAAMIVVALSVNLLFQRPGSEPHIARIVGVSGSLVWTGDGGQIDRELRIGTKLSGGTIEGIAPDSWFELEFNDGSTVMISGNAMLTFSDAGQKELRLKEGMISASVVPQPQGKPMRIHTRSALLEVLGTRFQVETSLSSTTLSVREGNVRVVRLSDGNTVDVPARHRVVAAPDRDLSPVRTLEPVTSWTSDLRLGSECMYGKWSPQIESRAATLAAIPFVPQENKSVTLYLLGLPVRRADNSPTIVKPSSRFVLRGRLAIAADIYFGIQMAHPNGEFAGKFITRQPASLFHDNSDFEAEFRLEEFVLDPCVRDRKDELPAQPDDLFLTGLWSFTHSGGPHGLEITQVELIPDALNQQSAGAR